MIIDDKIRDEKLQQNINRKSAKISALPSGKIGKYGCLEGEEILTPDEIRVKEHAKFIISIQEKFLKSK